MLHIKQIPVSIEHETLTDQQIDKYKTVAAGLTERVCILNLLDAINHDQIDTENNYLYLHEIQGYSADLEYIEGQGWSEKIVDVAALEKEARDRDSYLFNQNL